MLWGSQRPIQIHLKQEGRVLTRDGSSVSGLDEPWRGSLSIRRSSSSSSPSSGSSPSEGNTDRPPTPSSTMPSRLSVRAASSAAFSSWNNKKEMKASALQSKDKENLHLHSLFKSSVILYKTETEVLFINEGNIEIKTVAGQTRTCNRHMSTMAQNIIRSIIRTCICTNRYAMALKIHSIIIYSPFIFEIQTKVFYYS